MKSIKIPEACKPTADAMYGYSGGMALYIANCASFFYLFQIAHPLTIIHESGFRSVNFN